MGSLGFCFKFSGQKVYLKIYLDATFKEKAKYNFLGIPFNFPPVRDTMKSPDAYTWISTITIHSLDVYNVSKKKKTVKFCAMVHIKW